MGAIRQVAQQRVVIPDELQERVQAVDAPIIELSSTQIRERLANGQSVRYYVPDEVLGYIKRKQLYCKQKQQDNGEIDTE